MKSKAWEEIHLAIINPLSIMIFCGFLIRFNSPFHLFFHQNNGSCFLFHCNLNVYYWFFKSALTPRFCDELIQYGNQQQEQLALTGGQTRKKKEGKTDLFHRATVSAQQILNNHFPNYFGSSDEQVRKEFPINGYTAVRYDDTQKIILYENTELSQEYRNFDFQSSWNSINR